MRASILFIFLGLVPSLNFGSELPLPEYKNIAPGVWYGEVKVKAPPIFYHVIKVDLSAEKVAVKPIRPREDETLEQMAERLDSDKLPLLGAITGDYFSNVRDYNVVIPWGILIKENRLLFSPSGKSALCDTVDGTFHISVPAMKSRAWNGVDSHGISVTAVNRLIELKETDCGIYNSTWGPFAPEIPKGFAVTVTGDPDFLIDWPIKGTVSGISRLPVSVPIPENGFVMIMEELPSPDQLELKLGSTVMLDIEVTSSPENAIGGGPRILRGGGSQRRT